MKITNAWIVDPWLQGERAEPYLVIEVDELSPITIGPDSFHGGWIVSKSGPLVTYTQHDAGAMLPSPIDAGDFNKRFAGRFPVVVDVLVMCEGDAIQGYSLPLSRARSLLRKHANGWRLHLDERTAEKRGQLRWRPVEVNPSCHWTHDNVLCGKYPARPIPLDGIEGSVV